MPALPLKFGCGPYDRTEALRNGIIQPEGIDLTYVAVEPPPILIDRMVKDGEFDASEMFLALYMSLRARGEFPFVAIPVFPSRVFRHAFMFVNTNSGIRVPQDLAGKRVGVPEFRQTASVWIKGILQHEYDVDLHSIHWFEGGDNRPRARDLLDVQPDADPDIDLQFIGEDKTLSAMLADGEIDALLGARRPNTFGVSPHVQRLFPNYRQVEQDYYRKTGLFPIMHTVVLKEELHREHPWVARSLFQAMQESKDWVMSRMLNTGTLRFMLPWMFEDLEEMDRVFEGDPWVYGLEPNRHILNTLMGYLVEQGLMERAVPLEELFASVE